ncbi:hypothetical protein LEP1GSC171_0489 [Leptospira santarosai str. HAI1380]|nr:hypothetical protein LEP1GSC171_0489 [Leptospira santarosai str. HAI1380]
MIILGNVDDRNSEVVFPLSKNIFGKLFAGRGYISQLRLKVFLRMEFSSLQN